MEDMRLLKRNIAIISLLIIATLVLNVFCACGEKNESIIPSDSSNLVTREDLLTSMVVADNPLDTNKEEVITKIEEMVQSQESVFYSSCAIIMKPYIRAEDLPAIYHVFQSLSASEIPFFLEYLVDHGKADSYTYFLSMVGMQLMVDSGISSEEIKDYAKSKQDASFEGSGVEWAACFLDYWNEVVENDK